jgi:diguanylate cyclase (GGDEF)-like protein
MVFLGESCFTVLSNPSEGQRVGTIRPRSKTVAQLEVYGFCLITILILWISGDRRRKSKTDFDVRLFRALLLSTAAMVLTDSANLYFNGKGGDFYHSILVVSNTLYYLFHALPIPLAILYADFQIFRDEKRFRKLGRPLAAIVSAIAILAILSPFFGLEFYIDGENRYRRGPWFPALAASQFILSAFLIWHIVHNRKRMNRRIFTVLFIYPMPMVVAAALQTAFYGLTLLWPTMTLFLVTVAFNIENRRSKTDFLTGTANRRSLDEELERRIESSKSGRKLCGLLIDIDSFKEINDRFGHEAGDRALEDVANVLIASVRVDDHVARMGGDEFVVLADSKEPIKVDELVNRIETSIEKLNGSGQRPYRLSLSIGRSVYDPEAGGTGAIFLAILDSDMYSRKGRKRRPAGHASKAPSG